MLLGNIDTLGLSAYKELQSIQDKNPEYVYYFQFLNVGIEIKRNHYSIEKKCVIRNTWFYHVNIYNWIPDFNIIKSIYFCDIETFRSNKWNRKYIVGDFLTLDGAKQCFCACVRLFTSQYSGHLF